MNRKNPRLAKFAGLALLLASLLALALTGSGVSAEQQAASSSTAPQPQRDERLWRRALEIHRKAIVVDGHNDITSPMIDEGYDLGTPSVGKYHTDIPRMKQGGVTGQFFSIYVDQKYAKEGGSARRAMDMMDSVYRLAERHPEDFFMAT